MKKTNAYHIDIDKKDDGMEFKMAVYNLEKAAKGQPRMITRNSVLELNISRSKYYTVEIVSFGLGIVSDRKIIKTYSSKKLRSELPITLQSTENKRLLFYAYEIRKILGQYQNEKGIFLVNKPNAIDFYRSSLFDGDELEKIITSLETDEMSNWGSKDFYRLDLIE